MIHQYCDSAPVVPIAASSTQVSGLGQVQCGIASISAIGEETNPK
jgi:hypothetical protein